MSGFFPAQLRSSIALRSVQDDIPRTD